MEESMERIRDYRNEILKQLYAQVDLIEYHRFDDWNKAILKAVDIVKKIPIEEERS